MACTKHPLRKRKDCPDCQAELAAPTEKTSREMLAEISSMEKEVDEMVIKAPRKQREKKAVEEKVEVVINTSVPEVEEEIPIDKLSLFQESVNKIVENALNDFKRKIKDLTEIRYEWLDLPYSLFSVKVLDRTHSDGWRLVDFYKGECAKVSGFKGDVVLLSRVVSDKWKKSAKEWREEIK